MNAREVVLGIDSSTQSTKVIAWDRAGTMIAEGRAPVAMSNPRPAWLEQDPSEWWRSLVSACRDLWRHVPPERVTGIAISNQRETVAFLDESGAAVRPAITWLDERARPWVSKVADALGADALHEISGKPVDITPVVYRLAWMRDNEPEAYQRTATFADVQAYLNFRLTGSMVTSWASADPMGTFDVRNLQWSQPILDHLGVTATRCPAAVAPGEHIGAVSAEAAEATGLIAGTPLFAGAGDGQCAAVGTRCTAPGNAYVNLGTAIVAGVWSPDYALARSWRTLLSGSARGYVLEAVQRTGAFLINWFVDTFEGKSQTPEVFAALEQAARRIPVGSQGLLTLPYWSGCMNPHWDPDVRGCFVGVGNAHGKAHFYRSVLEGLTLEIVAAVGSMASAGVSADRFIVIGGGTESDLWMQILADAMGQPVSLSTTREASALGAAMIAAAGAGWFADISRAADAMAGDLREREPDSQNTATYRELLAIHEQVYAANAPICKRLERFQQAAGPSTT